MGGGFVPFRRDVVYVPAHEAPIAPLLDAFEFVEDCARWGWHLHKCRRNRYYFDSCLRTYHAG
jgi:hypothetical protein